jgi:hypothetical protein
MLLSLCCKAVQRGIRRYDCGVNSYSYVVKRSRKEGGGGLERWTVVGRLHTKSQIRNVDGRGRNEYYRTAITCNGARSVLFLFNKR